VEVVVAVTVEGLNKTTKYLSYDSPCPCNNSELSRPQHRTRLPAPQSRTRPTLSISDVSGEDPFIVCSSPLPVLDVAAFRRRRRATLDPL
jgi:hypothetical protein